jgi:hypothetical protein
MSAFEEFENANDAKFGKGKWHCDDIADAKDAPECVLAFLAIARAPAHGIGRETPKLFATLDGHRVRVVMASRFGDVGVTRHLDRDHGYEKRVYLPTLSDFSATAKPITDTEGQPSS